MNDIHLIITEDGSHSLFDSGLNETYHSIHGAIQESSHVFIKAGLEHWLENNKKSSLRILEIGFGTGLNAFLTAIYSLNHDRTIYYRSWEAFPINEEISDLLNYPIVLGSPDLFKSLHTASWEQAVVISSSFTLHKHNGDLINDSMEDDLLFDLIYYDAFGPSKQSAIWTKEVLTKVANTLDVRGSFVTYCAKGQVKRDLKSLGLMVETLPGPPGKLQMIRATRKFPSDSVD